MSKPCITELVLRDGHQSLLATRMTTADMLPAARMLDGVGFWSLEVWGGATFDACIRFLNEDPWERLRKLKAAAPNTRMQMLLRGQNLLGYRHYADDVVRAFVARAAGQGVDVFRVFDALNDLRNLRTSIEAVKAAGKHAQGTLSYATTPVHTLAMYVGLARELQAMGCDSICIKDMAGLLKPYDALALVREIKRQVPLPLQIHSHATTGMSVGTLVKAVEGGADALDTTISSMAMGTSHSPTETIVEIFKGTEWDMGLDLKRLVEIAAHFREVRRKYSAFESSFAGADTRILVSQIPGGMLSNLESQLKEQGAADRMDQVMDEIAVVQRDFGYPPLVTPTSQIVGTQAAFNVMMGRYHRLTAESQNLLAGRYGRTPAAPDAALVARALGELGLTRAVTERPADDIPNELDRIAGELRKATGGEAGDEDVLTYAMFPQPALAFFRKRHEGPVAFAAKKPEAPAAAPGRPASPPAQQSCVVTVGERSYRVRSALGDAAGRFRVDVDGKAFDVRLSDPGAEAAPEPRSGSPADPDRCVPAPMPGVVVRLPVAEGTGVGAGDTVVVMEAMKMQLDVKTRVAGKVRYRVRENESVKAGAVLAEVQ